MYLILPLLKNAFDYRYQRLRPSPGPEQYFSLFCSLYYQWLNWLLRLIIAQRLMVRVPSQPSPFSVDFEYSPCVCVTVFSALWCPSQWKDMRVKWFEILKFPLVSVWMCLPVCVSPVVDWLPVQEVSLPSSWDGLDRLQHFLRPYKG